MNDRVREYWEIFCEEKNISKDMKFEAWSFGNTREMADELAELVKKNIKTATTSAYELYGEDEPIPEVGEYNIILNGSDEPVCIIVTKEVKIVPYNEITPDHAWREGEGDRTYEYWRKVHDEFFEEEYRNMGKKFCEDAPMVCEVFEKVWG